jgi:Lipocalin-like domain
MAFKDSLVGTWHLVSYVEKNVDTGEVRYPMGKEPAGFIIYTADGYMSVQLEASGRQSFASNDMFGGTGEEYTRAGRTYLAYAGPFSVDEANRKLHHEIVVSLFPNWEGNAQVRLAELDGKNLRLSFERPQLSNGAIRTAELLWTRALERSAF